jgi:hypothetical protein
VLIVFNILLVSSLEPIFPNFLEREEVFSSVIEINSLIELFIESLILLNSEIKLLIFELSKSILNNN